MLASLRPTIEKAVANLPAQVRFRAQNSLEGFRRARILLSVDREIASFRAITAEEEAAAALFRALQLRKYPGADALSLRMHHHKAAAGFFLAVLARSLSRGLEIRINLTVQVDPPAITIGLPVNQFSKLKDAPPEYQIVLSDPLGLLHNREGVSPSEIFDDAVKEAAGDANVDRLIAKAANARNTILYAHDSGVPRSQVTEKGIDARQRNADVMLILATAVLQTDVHQPMALQSLQGFLKVLKRTGSDIEATT